MIAAVKLPRHAELWVPDYVQSRWNAFIRSAPKRVWVAITDHYEPFWKNQDEGVAWLRVDAWSRQWPAIAARHPDSSGRAARYSFFYPEEEYRPHLLESLAGIARAGLGDVEVHIHHNGEGEQNFLDRMNGFLEALHSRHGLLRCDPQGRTAFGFIHGNWTLDNSHPDGRWCGLNNEITLLRDLGCYADFTMPCGPLPMQARTLNTIYWVSDDPHKPKSYDRGIPFGPDAASRPQDLLMIPGPFAVRWVERLLPRLEIGELAHGNPVNRYRVRRWLDVAPRVGDDAFVKLFSHGTQERNSDMLLGGGLDDLYRLIAEECRTLGCQYYFVTAWELRQAVDAALTPKVRSI